MDPPQLLNLAIIGCGHRARAYLHACGDLFHCVACCDHSRDAAEALRSEWHIGAAYVDPRKLLRRKDIDGVMLLTPATTHVELVSAIAQAGKHVYVDGLLATTPEAAHTIVETCRNAAVHLDLGQHQRSLPQIAAAKRVLASGLIGAPFLAHWETVGLHLPPTCGPEDAAPELLFEGIGPEIDLLCYLLERPVAEVYARGGRGPFRSAPGKQGRETWAVLTLTLAGGPVAQMFHSWDCHGEQQSVSRRFHIECDQGTIWVPTAGPDTVAAYLSSQQAWLRPDLPEDRPALRRNLKGFLDRMTDSSSSEPHTPTPDQFYAAEALWTAKESLARNEPVAVQPLFPSEPEAPPPPETPNIPSEPPLAPERIQLSPEEAARYAARLVPQPDPPVAVIANLPASLLEESEGSSSEKESPETEEALPPSPAEPPEEPPLEEGTTEKEEEIPTPTPEQEEESLPAGESSAVDTEGEEGLEKGRNNP